jgi:hypothetical protein
MSLWDRVLSARHGDKLKPVASVSRSDATATETEAAIRQRIAAAEATRIKELTMLCDLAGKSERLSELVDGGLSLSEGIAALAADTKPLADRVAARRAARLALVRSA